MLELESASSRSTRTKWRQPSFLVLYYISMPFLLLLLVSALFALTGCQGDSRSANLEITYLKDGERERASWECKGKGCDLLNGIIWKPVLPGELCPEGYGGTDLVKIKGLVGEEKVNASFQRTNMCEIARFDSLEPLLRYNGIKGGSKDRSRPSQYLGLAEISHEISRKLPFLDISIITVLTLMIFLGLIYAWLLSLQLAWQKRGWRVVCILPPVGVVVYVIGLIVTKSSPKGSIRNLLDSGIILGTLFLPWQIALAVTAAVVYLSIRNLREDEKGQVSNEQQNDDS